MLDPSIILAGRPAPIENPMQMYSQMLSARALQQQTAIQQQQAQQRATLYPYEQQQQQAAAQEAQIRVRQAQQAQQDQKAWGDSMRQAALAPSGKTQTSGAPPADTQTGGDQTAAAPAYGYGPDNPVGPGNPQTAPAAPAAQGTGPPSHPLDLMTALDDAFQNRGMSLNGYLARKKQILDDIKQRADTYDADAKATDVRHDDIARRLVAFTDNTPEYQQANWKNFNQQLLTDKLYTEPEYSAVIAQHPDLPDPDTLDNYILHMRSISGQNKAAELLNQQTTAQARQTSAESLAKVNAAKLGEAQAQADQAIRANWGGQLAAQTTQEGFNAIVDRMPDDLAKQVNLLTDGEFDPDQTPGIIQKWSQTPEQQVTSGATAATRAETAAYHRARLGQEGKSVANETAQAQRAAVSNQAARALAESAQGGGSGYDDAIRNVQQFYQNDPDMQPVRGLVIGELARQRAVSLAYNRGQQDLNAKQDMIAAGGDMTKFRALQAARQAPPAPPAPGGASKIFPRSKLNDFAAVNHMTPSQAEQALKTSGYTVQ